MFTDARPHIPARPARAASSSATPSAASAAWRWPRSCTQEQAPRRRRRSAGPQAAAPPGQGEVGDLPVHGRRAEPPRDVRSQAAAEQARRPAAARRSSARRSISSSRATPSCSAPSARSGSTARAASRSPTCSRTPPQCIDDIAVIRSCHGDMVVHSAAQYELFTGRVVPGFPSMGSWVALRAGLRERFAAGLRRDARPEGRARSGPADVHATASCRRSISRRCSAPATGRCSISTCRRAFAAEQRRRDARADPRPERGDARPGRRGVRRPDQRLRPRLQDADRGARGPRPLAARRRRRSTCTASATEPTHDYGRRCLLARKLVEKGVRFVCVVSGGGPGNMQWDAHNDIEENHLRMAARDRPAGRRPAQGPEAPRPARQHARPLGRRVRPLARSASRARAATTTTSASRCGWPAAASRAARSSARPTPSACRPSRSPYHFRDIHTTILHQLGLDQHQLTYPHLGRDERLTFVEGKVIKEIV